MAYDITQTVLAGVDNATLQGWLTDAQAALGKLMSGQQVVTVIVTGGGQHREVTYRNDRNQVALLNQWIRMLQAQLGIICAPRRPINVTF
jgi:hypothetical protein